MTAGGQGYTTASVAVGGSGAGAAARAVVANGAVIGVVMTGAGSGYGAMGTQVPVTITGDGTGATAFGYAGLPVPEERRLLIRCNCSVAVHLLRLVAGAGECFGGRPDRAGQCERHLDRDLEHLALRPLTRGCCSFLQLS